jgi:hypothetical protein
MEKNEIDRSDFSHYLKITRPRSDLYMTVSHKKAFSGEYVLKIPNNLKDRSFASVLGTAFDYLARFLIARMTINNKDEALKRLKAEEGIELFNEKYQKIINDRYLKSIEEIYKYIHGENLTINEVIIICCFFARLEHNARTRWIPNENQLEHIEQEDKEIILELTKMSKLFIDEFIKKGMVRANSVVIYNPHFGICTKKLKGADADIFIDGVLWDFKTTKHSIAKPQDETQMWQYYIYDNVSKMNKDESSSLFKYEIKALAFYKARFGEIEFLKVNNIKRNLVYAVSRNVIDTLLNLSIKDMTINEAFLPCKNKMLFTKR